MYPEQLPWLFLIFMSINFDTIGTNDSNNNDQVRLMKPSLYSIESFYECVSEVIVKLHGFKFIQTFNMRCNEVNGEIQSFNLSALFVDKKTEEFSVKASTFVDNYRGMRTLASDGIIDQASSYCSGDRIVLIEVELPKIGNCNIGIFQQESLLAFARIKGKCNAFCPGKVSIKYITPLTNN